MDYELYIRPLEGVAKVLNENNNTQYSDALFVLGLSSKLLEVDKKIDPDIKSELTKKYIEATEVLEQRIKSIPAPSEEDNRKDILKRIAAIEIPK